MPNPESVSKAHRGDGHGSEGGPNPGLRPHTSRLTHSLAKASLGDARRQKKLSVVQSICLAPEQKEGYRGGKVHPQQGAEKPSRRLQNSAPPQLLGGRPRPPSRTALPLAQVGALRGVFRVGAKLQRAAQEPKGAQVLEPCLRKLRWGGWGGPLATAWHGPVHAHAPAPRAGLGIQRDRFPLGALKRLLGSGDHSPGPPQTRQGSGRPGNWEFCERAAIEGADAPRSCSQTSF